MQCVEDLLRFLKINSPVQILIHTSTAITFMGVRLPRESSKNMKL